MTIHQDLQAHINRSRNQQDRDVAIEELEEAIERIDSAVGFKITDKVPKLDKKQTADEVLNEARTCIRNDDLTGARIRMMQAINAGGGSAPELDEDKSIHDMRKAELIAYAAAQDPPMEITASGNKATILGQIEEAHDARNADTE